MEDFSKIQETDLPFEASFGTAPDPQFFKFEREDWTSFRTIEGLQQKAGVPRSMLRALVIKELADNGLDTKTETTCGTTASGGYFVEDAGPGIDGGPEKIASLFSIKRHLVSSKLERLPTRGALGNGLRVVASAVLASSGSLSVYTKNQRIGLRPETDGSTTVISVTAADQPVGTRIEVSFGPDFPEGNALGWAMDACRIGTIGDTYAGKTSPFWYDAAQFHELLLASGDRPVRDLLARFDGCSGAKAGAIVTKADLSRANCSAITRQQATTLLQVARHHARTVKPERLGLVGPEAFPDHHHAVLRGVAEIGHDALKAAIPFVSEAWVRKTGSASTMTVRTFVNKTPTIDKVGAYREDKTNLCFHGCGLDHFISGIPSKGTFDIQMNITTPYCPITSDGKAPDLSPFADHIADAVKKAVGMAHRDSPIESRKVSIKDVVLGGLDAAVAKASGDGAYEFNSRQVFYILRDVVKQACGKDFREPTFQAILTEFENAAGDIAGMYREPRGSLLHPHSDDGAMPLGTLSVRSYVRPAWTFNKILYVEKEGFTQALQAVGWPERHDCAILSSKGYTTRAARDLIDKLVEHDEPVTVFCVHDADAFGSMIFQTFQEQTKARGARKIQIINLGLEPAEALAMGLSPETLDADKRNKPVADYVPAKWRDWLQTNRVELNAMTMPVFIAWLDAKMEHHGDGKLVPPPAVLSQDLEVRIEMKLREAIRERILRDALFEEQVAAAVRAINAPSGQDLVRSVEQLFDIEQDNCWRDQIEEVASDLVKSEVSI